MRALTEAQKEASTLRVDAWRAKQLEERPEEYKKHNAERAKAYYHENPELAAKQQENFKRSYAENPVFRAKVIRSASTGRYRMAPTEYDSKLAEQGGHCALCPSTDGDAGRRLHIDHSHECCDGKARTCGKCNRGLLCGKCNRRLEKVEFVLKQGTVVPLAGTWLYRAVKYLEAYAWQNAK